MDRATRRAAGRAAGRALGGVVLAALALGCTACQDYLARRDTLTLGSGDAVQANIAMQVIDPFPARAQRTDADFDGSRLQKAIEAYRNPRPTNAAGDVGIVPVGGAVAPPPVPPSVR